MIYNEKSYNLIILTPFPSLQPVATRTTETAKKAQESVSVDCSQHDSDEPLPAPSVVSIMILILHISCHLPLSLFSDKLKNTFTQT